MCIYLLTGTDLLLRNGVIKARDYGAIVFRTYEDGIRFMRKVRASSTVPSRSTDIWHTMCINVHYDVAYNVCNINGTFALDRHLAYDVAYRVIECTWTGLYDSSSRRGTGCFDARCSCVHPADRPQAVCVQRGACIASCCC